MRDEIVLRKAEPADYDTVIRVVDEWWGRPLSVSLPRLFLDHFADTSTIAEADGALAGFLIGFLSPSVKSTAYIQFIGIHPDHRGGGLARELYERFFDMARADGRTIVRAITSPVNTGSINFHRKMGFTVAGPIQDYNGPERHMMTFERNIERS
ncbi:MULTISPECIES: GNAT family N-acetyltransferase [unclassified Nocardia]|uniref:GNAT family N-acetyltransferase n=1 Tax=unclassified Nocardia TaxID=2637762 RepID=UPI001CE48D03|nr:MULTISPECIES: GNAT family N-acetyltransferase [unclassified Nocardia]